MAMLTQKESNELFLTYPYRYAHKLANLLFPGFYYDEETGFAYPEDTHVGFAAFYDMRAQEYEFPFTKKDYDENEEIQEGLSRYYLDPEAFWHALLLLHFLAEKHLIKVYRREETQLKKVKEAIKFLDTQGSSFIARKGNGRKKEISDPNIVSFIRSCLESSPFINDNPDEQIIRISNRASCSYSEIMSYEAQALIEFFRKECKPEFDKRGKRYTSPLLLISKLMHFTGLAHTEDYLISSDTLKGIIRSYPKPGSNTVSLYTSG